MIKKEFKISRQEFAKQQLAKYPETNKIAVTLPNWVEVGKNVDIYSNVQFNPKGLGYIKLTDGSNELTHIPHSGRVVIGDNVEIHAFTNIDRATADNGVTRIGNGTKIDCHVHIGHNVQIGENCIIVAGTKIGGSSEIGNNCWLGINCSIRNKVKIGNNVTIGMGAVVVNDIPDNSIVIGNPAKPIIK